MARPSRHRDRLFAAGTLGGIAAGVSLASALSRWIETDLSALGAVAGMCLGLAVAMLVAGRSPRHQSKEPA